MRSRNHIHINKREATVTTKQKRRTVAMLGNFVVEVALRITDARQEVGTAEAARGPRYGDERGERV